MSLVPACGGTETPTKYRNGRTCLYCWDTDTGEHVFVDCQTDMPLSKEEEQELYR